MLFLQAVKVSVNMRKDLFSFAATQMVRQPLFRKFIALGIITSIHAMTQWDDVCRDSTGTIGTRQWYPMVLCKKMPQARRSTANSAAAVEVIERVLPIGKCERVEQIKFSGFTSLLNDFSAPVSVIDAAIFPRDFSRMLKMILAIFKRIFAVAFSIVFAPPLASFIYAISTLATYLSVFTNGKTFNWNRSFANPTERLFTIPKEFYSYSRFNTARPLILFGSFFVAGFTDSGKTDFGLCFIEVIQRRGEKLKTTLTLTMRKIGIMINHSSLHIGYSPPGCANSAGFFRSPIIPPFLAEREVF